MTMNHKGFFGINKLLTIGIVLLPILNTSKIGTINFGFGDLFLVFVLMLEILTRHFKTKINKNISYLIYLVLYMGILSLLCCMLIPAFSISSAAIAYIRYLVYGAILVLVVDYFDVQYAVELYINVSVIEAVYCLIQYFSAILFHISLPYVFPFAYMEYGTYGAVHNSKLYALYLAEGMRGVGFFPEASHFAQYTLCALIFLIFKVKKTKKDFIKGIVILVAFFSTKSGIGIAALAMVVAYYFIGFRRFSTKGIKRFFLMVLVSAPFILLLAQRFGLNEFIRQRFYTIFEKTYAVSGNIRMLRGFYVYSGAPTILKFFGMGCGNYINYINAFNIYTFFDLVMERTNEYMSGLATLFVRTGVVGIMMFSVFLIHLYTKLNRMQKSLFFVFVFLMCVENFFFSSRFITMICFLCVSATKYKNVKQAIH